MNWDWMAEEYEPDEGEFEIEVDGEIDDDDPQGLRNLAWDGVEP